MAMNSNKVDTLRSRRVGMRGATDAVERLQSILDRPLRTYTAFVREVVPAA
jgi:hypothetical protein